MENPWADRIEAIRDPVKRAVEIGKILNDVPEIHQDLRKMRQAAVLELRAEGWTYAKIAEAIGVHRNTVQQIADGRTVKSRRSRGSNAED